jgi:hypothetical protein
MKFWEKFQPEQLKVSETKSWWWWAFVALGFVIGVTAVALVVLLMFLVLGFFASLLWNYAVAPIFNISELTTYTASALLFLVYATIRIVKWALD